MLEMVGITSGAPNNSPLNECFECDGVKWTIRSGSVFDQDQNSDEKMIIKRENRADGDHRNSEMVLFGTLFYSMFHITSDDGAAGETRVGMTERAKVIIILMAFVVELEYSTLKSHRFVGGNGKGAASLVFTFQFGAEGPRPDRRAPSRWDRPQLL